MKWQDFLHCFELDNHIIVDNQVNFVAAVELKAFGNWQVYLLPERQPTKT